MIDRILSPILAVLYVIVGVYTMHLCLNDYAERAERINCELIWGDCPE